MKGTNLRSANDFYIDYADGYINHFDKVDTTISIPDINFIDTVMTPVPDIYMN